MSSKVLKFSRFGLSVFGRALLVNSCILSHLWYASSFSVCLPGRLKKVWSTVMGFVYGGLPGFRHLSYAHSRLSRVAGGLGVLDPVLEFESHSHNVDTTPSSL